MFVNMFHLGGCEDRIQSPEQRLSRYIVYPFLTENSLVFNLHVLQKGRITAGEKFNESCCEIFRVQP